MKIDTTLRQWCKDCQAATTSVICPYCPGCSSARYATQDTTRSIDMWSNGNSFGASVCNGISDEVSRWPVPAWKFGVGARSMSDDRESI